MNLTDENKKNILNFFKENEWYPTNTKKLIEYLKENNYIKTKEDVFFENIELLDIKVPSYHFLDEDYIVNNDDDYIEIGGNKYLNEFEINQDVYDIYANNLIKFKSESD